MTFYILTLVQQSVSFIQKLIKLFNRRNPPSFAGSTYPIGIASSRTLRYQLEIPENPVRPILNDVSNSYDLCEIKTWSYEARHAMSIISRDCFQQEDGMVSAWRISEKLDDGTKVHSEVIAIGLDLAHRYCQKKLILGGDRLQRAVRELLWCGDSFLELAIDKEGIGRNDWGISNTLYLPPLSMFIDQDIHGQVDGYWERSRMMPSQDDILIHPLKMLHFCWEEQGVYGLPIFFQSLETWRKMKKVAEDIEEAARAIGVTPWIHVMPEGKDDLYKQKYQREYEDRQRDGIITSLFLANGAEVRKAAGDSSAIAPLLDYWMQLRYRMLPPGMPTWLIPGLSQDASASKDLNNQPAMAYARLIASMRGIIGEQLKWAITLEIVLRKGFDWYLENGKFDIIWAEWAVSPLIQYANSLNKSDNG